MNDRLVIIVFIGLVALGALAGGVYLFSVGKENPGLVVIGLTTSALALLAPSPLSKNFVPPDPALDDTPNKEAIPMPPPPPVNGQVNG